MVTILTHFELLILVTITNRNISCYWSTAASVVCSCLFVFEMWSECVLINYALLLS